MGRQTKVVNLSLPADVFAEVDRMAKEEGKPRSEILREALKRYVASEKRWQQIRKWGEQTAEKYGIKDEDDVERIVDECREEYEREHFSK